MTSGGDISEVPFELPTRVQAGRRKRWLIYAAALAAASVFFVGGAFTLGTNNINFPAMALTLIPFPGLWVAIQGADWVPMRAEGTFGSAITWAWFALVYAFIYLFVLCLPTFYRRKVLGVPWWFLQIILLLPGIGWGIA